MSSPAILRLTPPAPPCNLPNGLPPALVQKIDEVRQKLAAPSDATAEALEGLPAHLLDEGRQDEVREVAVLPPRAGLCRHRELQEPAEHGFPLPEVHARGPPGLVNARGVVEHLPDGNDLITIVGQLKIRKVFDDFFI